MNMHSIATSLLLLPALVSTARAQAPNSPPVAPESAPAPQAPAPTAQEAAPVYVPPEGAPPSQEAQPALVQPAPAYYAPPPPSNEARPGAHLHDGFYLRLSLGFGAGSATQDYASNDVKYSGTAMMFDVLIGGSPLPGLVLGGGLVGHTILSPTIKLNGTDQGNADSDVSLDMSTLGLFTAFYPDPRIGFNIHALVGYSVISASNGNARTTDNPTGLSVMGGVGYDFWVSDQWSIGPDVRIAYAKTSFDEGDGIKNEISMFVPTLSFTATYH